MRPQASGVINTRTVDTGQFVRVGNVLATIVDASRLRLRFKVSEAESLRAEVGGSVTSASPPWARATSPRRSTTSGEIADTTTRQVEVLGLGRGTRASSSPGSSPR